MSIFIRDVYIYTQWITIYTSDRSELGPSIAWHLGHLLSYRSNGLKLLGHDADNPYKLAFGSSPATDGRDYPTAAELGAQWTSLSQQFMAALASATDEDLQAPVPSGAHAEECVQDKFAFFAFHEGYHIGSITALQKEFGKSSPPEKIMAAMKGAN